MNTQFAPCAYIDTAALRHNAAIVRGLAPRSKMLAMVKADAYGHGLIQAVSHLAATADAFGVARLDEALSLRSVHPQLPIIVANAYPSESELQLCAERNIGLVVNDLALVHGIAQATLPRPLKLWLKLNSGMNRLGLSASDFGRARLLLQQSENCRELVLMSHLACADEIDSAMTRRQIQAFTQAAGEDLPVSLANSAALISYPQTRTDWVRPGIMLYGVNPTATSSALDLRPVMQLKTRVLKVHQLDVGQSVGYGAQWCAQRPSRIATLAIGYADGYPRQAPNGAPVYLRGQRAPLVGRVSMDLISVDVTDLPPVQIGDEAELWGENLPVSELAQWAGTISYDLLSGLQERVQRVYLE